MAKSLFSPRAEAERQYERELERAVRARGANPYAKPYEGDIRRKLRRWNAERDAGRILYRGRYQALPEVHARILALPEWRGSSVHPHGGKLLVRHPSGATLTLNTVLP